MSPASTVTIGGVTVALAKPASMSARLELASVVTDAGGTPRALRALAACLGAAWASPEGRPKADYVKHGYDPLSYGGAVLDELLLRGVPPADIVEGGQAAFLLLIDGLLGGSVQAHEDFSGRPEGA